MLSFKCRERLNKSIRERVSKFLKTTKAEHDKLVLSNRGIHILGIGNEKQNLGNELLISDKYWRDLDTDRNQKSPPYPGGLIEKECHGIMKSFVLISFQVLN